MTSTFPLKLLLVGQLVASLSAFAQQSDTTVIHANTPVHQGVATLDEVLSIGRADGPPEYLMVQVSELTLGPDGSIYVADRGAMGPRLGDAASIRRYDSTGTYVRSYGRSGQGPGEFQSFGGIRVHPDDRVLVYDPVGARVLVYADSGTPIRTVQSGNALMGGGSNSFFLDTRGSVWVVVRRSGSDPNAPPRQAAIRINNSGELADTVFAPPQPILPDNNVSAASGSGALRRVHVPFTPSFISMFGSGGYFVTAKTDEYAINLHIPVMQGTSRTYWKPGDRVLSIRRDAEPVRVSGAERRSHRSAIETRMCSVQPNWTWNGPDIPRVKPHFLVILTDLEGRIWARVFDPRQELLADADVDDSIENLWDVFEPAGRYLGRVRTPAGVLPQQSREDKLLWVQRDGDGVPRVVLYQIHWR